MAEPDSNYSDDVPSLPTPKELEEQIQKATRVVSKSLGVIRHSKPISYSPALDVEEEVSHSWTLLYNEVLAGKMNSPAVGNPIYVSLKKLITDCQKVLDAVVAESPNQISFLDRVKRENRSHLRWVELLEREGPTAVSKAQQSGQ